jgi:hypothetical protein
MTNIMYELNFLFKEKLLKNQVILPLTEHHLDFGIGHGEQKPQT